MLLAVDGNGEPLRWDGQQDVMEPAGVLPAATAPVIASSGLGAIVGTYNAYLRFVDQFGNFSNLSPVSNEITASSSTGSVSDVTNATPIVVTTSAAHGLTTGTRVKLDGVGGNGAANDSFLITVVDSTSFSLDDSSGTGAYTGGGTWTAGSLTITYTSVAIPQETKVRRRQILRNTDGQQDVYYVDVDSTDLSSSTFSSTKDDDTLVEQESQTLLDELGLSLANRYTPPPNWKSVVACCLGFGFYLVDAILDAGNVQVTSGSTSVTGVATFWTDALAGRFLYVKGAFRSYEIASISGQTLTLTEAYSDDTNLFALYAIRPAPAERRLVYCSEPGLPEAVPAYNAVPVPETNDELTGAMVKGTFLYLLESRHVHRWTFQGSPLLSNDGGIYPASDRGCVNQRCWIVVGNTAYMLDEEGVHALGGDQSSESLSENIAELFSPLSVQPLRVDWSRSKYFHAIYDKSESIMRWFVCLSGSWLPRHALAYHMRSGRWWLEGYDRPVGASCAGRMRNLPQVFLGMDHATVVALGQGAYDGPTAGAGTLRGTATSAGLYSLADTAASFASLVNVSVAITHGKGKGQVRRIVSNTATELTLSQMWLDLPDTTSTYQIGGQYYEWLSSDFRIVDTRDKSENDLKRMAILFEKKGVSCTLEARFYADFADEALTWARDLAAAENNGIEANEGESSLVVDLQRERGMVWQNMPGVLDENLAGMRYLELEVDGWTNGSPVLVWEISLDGLTAAR